MIDRSEEESLREENIAVARGYAHLEGKRNYLIYGTIKVADTIQHSALVLLDTCRARQALDSDLSAVLQTEAGTWLSW